MVPSLRAPPLPGLRVGSVQDGEVLRAGQGPQDGQLQKARWAAGGTTKQVLWNHQELGGCTGGGGGPGRAWVLRDTEGTAQGSLRSSVPCQRWWGDGS